MPSADSPAPPERGRYRAIRPHARGGLGEVLYAEEDALGRPVALKRLLGRRADDPVSQQRFLREAAITARLQHPGIVPVYGLTHDENGRPAYAMRFVDGESLLDAIAKSAKSKWEGLELRQLLSRFVTVCETIAYAHSRGVIHRDIKPANILLGPYGETLVVDWGLAKETNGGPSTADDIRGEPTTASDTQTPDQTQAGLAMGTPAYMSPEQAGGKWDEVGPASDIYSLGATLYHLLAGRPPFTGDAADILVNVAEGHYPSLRTINPKVPVALDAICRQAMALLPEDRYPSAQALAADVTRWLADEPVAAYCEPLRLRIVRWFRRRRALTAALAGLLFTTVVALVIGLFVVNGERLRTAAQRDEARKQRERTRESLDAMTSNLSEKWLKSEKQLRPEQIQFLQQALEYYRDFAQDDSNDEAGRSRVAHAQSRVATLLYNLDRRTEAEAAYQTALASWKKLAEDAPTNDIYRHGIAEAYGNLGNLLRDQGRYAEAEQSLRQSSEQYGEFARQAGPTNYARDEWAWSLNNYGVLLKSQGKSAAAEPVLQKAVDVMEDLVRHDPKNAEYSQDLANACANLGNTLKQLNRHTEAEAPYRRAIGLYERLAKELPAEPEYRVCLGRTFMNLAILYAANKAYDDAEKQYRRAIEVMEPLTRDYPASAKYRILLALIYANYSQRLLASDRFAQSLEWLDRSEQMLRGVLAIDATQQEPLRYLRYVLGGKVEVLHKLKRWPEAVAAADAALALDDGSQTIQLKCDRATARIKSGDAKRAAAEARELMARSDLTPMQIVVLAGVLAMAHAQTPDESYAADAASLLRRAYAADPKSVEYWKDDSDFAAVKDRPEVKTLLGGKP